MKNNLKKLGLIMAIACFATNASLFACSGLTQVATELAPKAIGPYSQAVKAGQYLFLSGQIAIDPATSKLNGDTIEAQTKQVLTNLSAVLAAEGLTFENVVKTEVYLKDLKDFAAMNRVYAEFFAYPVKPARATVQISKLPLDAIVEISCVAFIPE